MLNKVIEEASSGKLSVAHEYEEVDSWKFQVGNYVQFSENEDENNGYDDEAPVFWIGYGWEHEGKYKPCLWIEFDAQTCPPEYWDKINELVGTSGKYYREVDFEFTKVYMNAWVHFCLKEEYLEQFYDENIDINTQKKILVRFINEVLDKGRGEIFAAVKGAPTRPIRDAVVRLKRQGWTVKQIAKKFKIHPAEVELILEMRDEED